MLVASWEHGRIEASNADRGPAYVCPNCTKPVILKKGRIVIHHFAHKPPTTCAWATGETLAHLNAKKVLRDAFVARGRRAEVEVEVLSIGGDRRADVLVWSKDEKRQAAIEVQHQSIPFEAIERRTMAYVAAGTPVVWISLFNPKNWEHAKGLGDHLVIRRYSVRPWEKWAHAYGMGELWFFDPGAGKLWRGVFKSHLIEKEGASWYDQYGQEEFVSGYEYYSKKWRELHLHGPYEPTQIGLKPLTRKPYKTKNFDVPGGVAARVVLL